MATMHRITYEHISHVQLLANFLISEGWPNTVWFVDADTGEPTCVTMAPSVTVKSCIASLEWVG